MPCNSLDVSYARAVKLTCQLYRENSMSYDTVLMTLATRTLIYSILETARIKKCLHGKIRQANR